MAISRALNVSSSQCLCCGLIDHRLSIVSNEISGQGLCDIADSLCKKNHSIVQLFIWGNDLQESGCIVSLRPMISGVWKIDFLTEAEM